ncbi:synaptopodin-2 [Amia ocellicauda]|uniref:synaptopodin-2 n=1 Tax=Amia ocellicauda TaxID=2972642 RepID=UPI00346408B5
MSSASMGAGDYLCVTLRGAPPWGFQLRRGPEPHCPLRVSEVDEGGRAAAAGLCQGDEVVSLNGEPCADLSLAEAVALVDAPADSLQMLVKRCGVLEISDTPLERTYSKEAGPGEGLESTTLQIWPPGAPARQLYLSESQDEAYYGETESDTELPGGARLGREREHPRERSSAGVPLSGSFTPGKVVELQLSLSDHSLEDPRGRGGSTLGGTLERDGSLDLPPAGFHTEIFQTSTSTATSTQSFSVLRRGSGRGGDPLSSSSSLGQVEVTLQPPRRARRREEVFFCRTESSLSGCVDSPEEGGPREAPPASVSFGISTEGAGPAEEWDSESERDLSRPDKHHARHSRLRRSESLSEKQVKEAKSKCKRIALLLTAAPNPNNKGVLMFKRHRQRAKKFTLVSYGTGEQEPKDEDEEDEGDAIEVTFLATSESELDEDFFTDVQRRGSIVTFDWDTGLLEIEKQLGDGEEMERLPETKGKGALMFAKRRQRVDQITAEQEEMRRQGIPVEDHRDIESIQVTQHSSYQVQENSTYTQARTEHQGQAYIDVQKQTQQQKQQYSVSHSMNGVVHHQTSEVQKSIVTNKTARPFGGVQNRVPAPFSSTRSVNSPVSEPQGFSDNRYRVVLPPVAVNTHAQIWSPTGSGEQIASRDERISVPAIKTGILQDTRKRSTSKPMFTFKEPPKVSPNPDLLNLLHKGDKRQTGFESGPEEDYLSLGAEACNFLQSQAVKQKTPPPVAPKPSINPASPPWSPQPQAANQASSQPTLNEAHTAVTAAAAVPPQRQQTEHTWSPSQTQAQPAEHTWSPPQKQAQPAAPQQTAAAVWSPAQPQAQPAAPQQTIAAVWSPAQPQQQQQPPARAPAQTYTPPQQLANTWSQPQSPASAPLPARSVATAYMPRAKTPPTTPISNVASAGGMGPAFEMPALRGRGAELFAKRQSRMEKFVVDSETVQANKVRSPSPTPSLPNSWKFSPNVRAPPPLAYNPIHSPSYPPGAMKSQPQSSTAGKTKTKGKTTTKVMHALDVMKHQPYQLNSSLFTYGPATDAKGPAPKSTPAPAKQPLQYEPSAAVKPAGHMNAAYPVSQPQPPHYGFEPSSPAIHDGSFKPAANAYVVPSFTLPPKAESIAGVYMAPRPRFSAKKSGVAAQEISRRYSLSLPRRMPSMSGYDSPVHSPVFMPSKGPFDRQPSWMDKSVKPPSPWEAAARNPLGLVDAAFSYQNLQQSIASNVISAAHRKSLPEPPAAWKDRVSYESSQRGRLQHQRSSSYTSPSKSSMSAPASTVQYGSPCRYAYQPQRSMTDSNIRGLGAGPDYGAYGRSVSDPNYNIYPRAWRR